MKGKLQAERGKRSESCGKKKHCNKRETNGSIEYIAPPSKDLTDTQWALKVEVGKYNPNQPAKKSRTLTGTHDLGNRLRRQPNSDF